MIFEYTLDEFGVFEVFFREEKREVALFEDPFLKQGFKGFSFVGIAEFTTNYRGLSFGRHRINYSGNDQLFLKKCSKNDWSGHYVQTYIGGHFFQVYNLNCRAEVDAVDEILARLKSVQ